MHMISAFLRIDVVKALSFGTSSFKLMILENYRLCKHNVFNTVFENLQKF